MSFFIKGLEAPKNCSECIAKYPFFKKFTCYKKKGFDLHNTEHRLSDCPITEVESTHGNLVDQDDLIDEINRIYPIGSEYNNVYDLVNNAETVIEAEYEEPHHEWM